MDTLVGYLLAGGVILSMLFIATGLIWNYANTGHAGLHYSIQGMNFFQYLFSDVRQVLLTGLGPRRLVNLGIATLMLTPFLRVVASVGYFALAARNWKYVAFTTFVAGVLAYSLFLR